MGWDLYQNVLLGGSNWGGVSFLFLALLEHTGKPRSLLITDTPQGILQMLKLREWEDLEQDSEQP